MSAGYTPGPWRVAGDENGPPGNGPIGDILAEDGTHVVCFGHDYDDYGGIGARSRDWPPIVLEEYQKLSDAERQAVDDQRKALGAAYFAEARANANLIAAAPDLLEACKAFVVSWEKCLQLEKTEMALHLAKAAIAKAEG